MDELSFYIAYFYLWADKTNRYGYVVEWLYNIIRRFATPTGLVAGVFSSIVCSIRRRTLIFTILFARNKRQYTVSTKRSIGSGRIRFGNRSKIFMKSNDANFWTVNIENGKSAKNTGYVSKYGISTFRSVTKKTICFFFAWRKFIVNEYLGRIIKCILFITNIIIITW